MSRLPLVGLLVAAVAVASFFCIVIIDEREQAFRTLLSTPDPVRAVIQEPGIYLSIPGLHELYRYDRRALRYDAQPRELLLAENYLIEVDYYLIWKVENPQLLRENVPQWSRVLRLLDDTAFNELRTVLGQHLIGDLLSPKRAEMTRQIAQNCDAKLKPQGIAVLDVQIRRTNYPEGNLARIFDRMRTERARFAKRYRAEGEEEARKIRSTADRESRVLRAEATGDARRLRGEGEAEAAGLYAAAYGQDAEFYAFLRSMEAYKLALNEQTTLILSPKLPFLKYLFSSEKASTR